MHVSHRASPRRVVPLVALALLVVALLAPAVASAASGDLLWARGVEIGPLDEEFVDLAKGPNGSVYAVGGANYGAGACDILVAKFSAAGKLQWRRVVDGPAHGYDIALAVAVDDKGNAYVTGRSASAVNGGDALTLKYSSSGERLWAKRYNGMANAFDEGADIALDGSGRPYVAMTSTVMGGENIVVVKYGVSGSKVWEGMWAGPGEDDEAKAIAVDSRGRAYVAGRVETLTQSIDAVVVRFKATGGVQWAQMYNGDADLADWGAHVMLRGDHVYLSGVSTRAGGRFSFLVAKCVRDGGALKWVRVSDVTGDVDRTGGLWVDASGNVSVCGDLAVTGPEGKRGALVSWNKYGVFRYAKTYYRTATDQGAAFFAMTGTSDGVVYCTGWVIRTGAKDALLVKYRKDGSRAWVRAFNSDPYQAAYGQAVLLTGGTSGGIHLGGKWSTGASLSALVVKYRP